MFYLAWRNLSQSRIQFSLGVGGVALALLLMLALDALVAGSQEDLTAFINQVGADIFVAQDGVKNLHMAASAITWRDLRLASHGEGVASASPILYTTTVVETKQADFLSYVIGFDSTEPLGGPPAVLIGTNTLKQDETIIDEAIARSQELKLGDEIKIFGHAFTVVGLTRGLTNIINSIIFIRLEDFQTLRRGETLSYALLRVKPSYDPTKVAALITARNSNVTALTRADFAREEQQIIKDMSVELLDLMNISGLLIGLAVTALTLYTSTLRKRQEYGVLKAIGAKNWHLYSVVIAQAGLSLIIGLGLALGLIWLMGVFLSQFIPGVHLTLTGESLFRVLLASLLIGIVAALAPAWQIARLAPAQVFRG